MDLKWNGEIGPASIVGVIGSLSVLISIGILWGTFTTKIDTTTAVVAEVVKQSELRDDHVAAQSERLGRVETSVGFIVPTLQRIEAKLDRQVGPFTGWPPTASQPTPLTAPPR